MKFSVFGFQISVVRLVRSEPAARTDQAWRTESRHSQCLVVGDRAAAGAWFLVQARDLEMLLARASLLFSTPLRERGEMVTDLAVWRKRGAEANVVR